jgi:hypothetical protein
VIENQPNDACFLLADMLTIASAKISAQIAPVAQGIEHWIPNPGVACSNHAGGTTYRLFKLFAGAGYNWLTG